MISRSTASIRAPAQVGLREFKRSHLPKSISVHDGHGLTRNTVQERLASNSHPLEVTT
jgi:hypothetical protein